MTGVLGQVVQQHAATESKQEQELVLMIQETLPSHSVNKKVAFSTNVAMTLGHLGVVMDHAMTLVQVHINNENREVGLYNHLDVHWKANQFNMITTRRTVPTVVIGELVIIEYVFQI